MAFDVDADTGNSTRSAVRLRVENAPVQYYIRIALASDLSDADIADAVRWLRDRVRDRLAPWYCDDPDTDVQVMTDG